MPTAAAAAAAVTAAPWAATRTTAAPSLLDVMAQQFVAEDDTDGDDEALARRLQAQFDLEAAGAAPAATAEPPVPALVDPDLLLARKLQADFDRAYNRSLVAHERRVNGNAKVAVSFEWHRRPVTFESAADDDGDAADEHSVYAGVDLSQDEIAAQAIVPPAHKPATGSAHTPAAPAAPRKEIITKHDIPTNNRRNARRIESLPLSFNSGNTGQYPDLSISNRVFNQVREHSLRSPGAGGRNKQRMFGKEDVATSNRVLDPRTRLMLFAMMSSGVLPELSGVISSGKEANVYAGQFSPLALAEQRQNGSWPALSEEAPEEDDEEEDVDDAGADDAGADDELVDCAVKIFRTSLNEFKQREQYVRDDFRFNLRMKRSNPRKFITLWAEKEMHNLFRLQRAGVRSPRVLLYNKHILVMQLIGKQGRPAPKLHEVVGRLGKAKLTALYRDCLRMMRTMYQDAQLVHADLSAYNILYHNGKLWFIDVSQAVISSHVHAHEFLLRDCSNVHTFFASQGATELLTPIEMLAFVTFHPGRFARVPLPSGEVEVAEDDGDDEWSDTDTASVSQAPGGKRTGRKPQRTIDTLDYGQEDAFIAQVKRDVAALAEAHPVGVNPVTSASELLRYLLPTIRHIMAGDTDAADTLPGGHLNTATYRSAPGLYGDNAGDEDEEEDDEEVSVEDEDDEDSQLAKEEELLIDRRLVAQLEAALETPVGVGGPATSRARSKRQ